MANRTLAAVIAAACLALQSGPMPAYADNQMGYKLLTADEASALPRNGGKLGMEVGRADQITSGGLTFDILRVKRVVPSSPSAQAGFKVGDQIIAVDGNVFPTVAAFAAYIGSLPPARQVSLDYMPSNGGPKDAQRVTATLGGGSSAPPVQQAPAPQQAAPASTGLSTGTKVAIGIGAAALFGCYKLGCFSHRTKPAMQPQPNAQP